MHLEQQPASFRKKGDASRGDRDAALRAHKELDTQLALQRLDALGQRRRRDMQSASGTAEMQFFGNGDEGVQVLELHSAPK